MKTGKALTRKFDKLWRERVLENADYKCEYCGNTEGLNCHHIISRKNYSTRWYAPNGVVLCVNHHMFDNDMSAHGNPIGFSEWIIKHRSRRWWNKVMKQRNQIWRNWKLNLEDIEKHLKG